MWFSDGKLSGQERGYENPFGESSLRNLSLTKVAYTEGLQEELARQLYEAAESGDWLDDYWGIEQPELLDWWTLFLNPL